MRLQLLSMVLLVAGASQALAMPAVAQDREIEALRITPAEVQQHGDALDLTQPQLQAVEARYQQHGREFDDAAAMRNALLAWTWSQTDRGWHGGAPTSAFGERVSIDGVRIEVGWNFAARELETRWFDGLRAVALGQDDAIDSLFRARLRQRALPGLRYSGAHADLTALVRKFAPNLLEQPAAAQQLQAYELELDQLLRAYDQAVIVQRERNESTRSALRKANERGDDPEPFIARRIDALLATTAISQDIWNLTDRTARSLQPLLLPEQAAEFVDGVHAALHQYLHEDEEAAPELSFARALQSDSISQAHREELLRLRERYRAARAAAMPGVRAAYLRMTDLAEQRAFYTLYFGADLAQKRAAAEESGKRQEEWESARRPWQAECRKTLAAIAEQSPHLATQPLEEMSPEVQTWWDELVAPTMSREDFAACADALAFADENQAALFQTIYDDMATEHAALAGEVRNRMEQIRRAQQEWKAEHPDDDAWMQHARDFGWHDLHFYILAERERLDRKLEGDVSLFLSESQQQTWIAQTRALRRRTVLKAVKDGWHCRETYDLVALMEEIAKPDERSPTTLTAELLAYAEQMDRVLRRWQTDGVQAGRTMMANAIGWEERAAGGNAEKSRRQAEAAQIAKEIVADVVEVNQQCVSRVCEALPIDAAQRLREAVDRFTYPEAFHRTPAELAAEAIRFADDIAAEKRAAVEAILASHIAENREIRRQIVDVVRRWHRGEYAINRELKAVWEAAERSEITVEERQARLEELQSQHPANPLLEKSYDLARDAVARMRNVFSPDELAAMPLAVRLGLDAVRLSD